MRSIQGDMSNPGETQRKKEDIYIRSKMQRNEMREKV
jgi:hypothetical protein